MSQKSLWPLKTRVGDPWRVVAQAVPIGYVEQGADRWMGKPPLWRTHRRNLTRHTGRSVCSSGRLCHMTWGRVSEASSVGELRAAVPVCLLRSWPYYGLWSCKGDGSQIDCRRVPCVTTPEGLCAQHVAVYAYDSYYYALHLSTPLYYHAQRPSPLRYLNLIPRCGDILFTYYFLFQEVYRGK